MYVYHNNTIRMSAFPETCSIRRYVMGPVEAKNTIRKERAVEYYPSLKLKTGDVVIALDKRKFRKDGVERYFVFEVLPCQ